MIRLYDSVFASLYGACRWIARDDRVAPESAAVLIAAFEFLNIVTIYSQIDSGRIPVNQSFSLAALGFVFLIAFNLLIFLRRRRWKSVVDEFEKRESVLATNIATGIYTFLSVVMFIAVA